MQLWWQATSPGSLRLLRSGVMIIALLSIAWSLITAFRIFLSPTEVPPAAERASIAPARPDSIRRQMQIDIDRLSQSPLFGTPGNSAEEQALRERLAQLEAEAQALAGIEENARESRLPLLLVGLFYTADLERDRAVIESSQTQVQYAVGDELPVSGPVSVAKIMADRVILDNGGNYEFLRLYDESGRITSQASGERATNDAAESARQAELNARNRRIRELAAAQRRGAATATESLTSLINIEVASSGGALIGYRVSPARDRARMEALGFRDGDIITSVNDAPLNDASQAPRLSQALRSGGTARFGVLRDGQEISLTVGGARTLQQ